MIQEYFLSLSKNAPFVVMAVLGLGWLAGKLGLSGRWQLAAAFGSGVIIGAAFQIASVGIPKTFTEWFYVGITGIIMGLMRSGFYEALKSSAHKAAAWWLDKNEPNPPPPFPEGEGGKKVTMGLLCGLGVTIVLGFLGALALGLCKNAGRKLPSAIKGRWME